MISMDTETGLLLRVGLYLAIFWPVVGAAIYSDAKRNNISNPQIIAMAYGVLGPIGALFYWVRYNSSKNQSDQ